MAGALRVVVLATTLIAANAQNDIESTPADAKLLEDHPGCFHHRFRWTPDIEGTKTKVKSLAECQSMCRNNITGCSKIGYWPATGVCFFGTWTAHLVPAPSGGVAGHGDCTQVELDAQNRQACSAEEVPPPGEFPAKTLVGSHKIWPSGRQPWSLECWPVAWKGGYVSCAASVLAATKDGWAGQCKGLVRQYNVGPHECAQDCYRNPLCPSYKVTKNGECWQGMGHDCAEVTPGEEPLMAERLQHGQIRELTSLVGKQVLGLSRAFDNFDYHIASDDEAATACKNMCYSDIQCQYWQYAPHYGCWVEDQSTGVRPLYPLTDASVLVGTPFAEDVIAGMYIQHTCEESKTTVWPTQAPEIAQCMKTGVRYVPNLPMMRSIQANAAMCQSRCAENDFCLHFAFWPDGSCYQQGKDATAVTAEDPKVISGPQTCAVDFGLEAQDALDHPAAPGVTPEGHVPAVDIDPHAFDPPANANGVVQPPAFPTTTTMTVTMTAKQFIGGGGKWGDLGGQPEAAPTPAPAPEKDAARGLGNFWLCALVIPVVLAALAAFWYASRRSQKGAGEPDYSPTSSTGFRKLESSPGYSDSESGGEPSTPPQQNRQAPPPPPAAAVGQTPLQMVPEMMTSGAPPPAAAYSSSTSLVTMAASPEPMVSSPPVGRGTYQVAASPQAMSSPPLAQEPVELPVVQARHQHQRQLSANSARATAIAAAVSSAQPLPPLLSQGHSGLHGCGGSVSGISPGGLGGASASVPNFGGAGFSAPNFGGSATVPVTGFGGGGLPLSPQRLGSTNIPGARGTPAVPAEPLLASPLMTELAFAAIDRNHDGVITRDELAQALGHGVVQPQAMFR